MADRLTIILNFKSYDGTESELPQTYLTVAGKGNHLEKKVSSIIGIEPHQHILGKIVSILLLYLL